MIKLYTTHCPKCRILETKLRQQNIEFEISTDIDEIIQKGFQAAPVLEIDGELIDYGKAIQWVNNYKKED